MLILELINSFSQAIKVIETIAFQVDILGDKPHIVSKTDLDKTEEMKQKSKLHQKELSKSSSSLAKYHLIHLETCRKNANLTQTLFLSKLLKLQVPL